MKKDFLKLNIKRFLRDNPNTDISELIARLISSEKERYIFSYKLSDSMIQMSHILNISERTIYRNINRYDLKLKEEEIDENNQSQIPYRTL